ncbi:amidase [Streptomyces iconiensis]|uniref:Amidase n=1 Tax=Streptomyces iconiensis TaxID=1384038 RepID=A0ABT7A970_9ACTN|nr:amidase [Streptomyces iconiensis]MDJ1137871.1 amidase [Streptomyces iconiensis]
MDNTRLHDLTATEQAAAVRAGTVSPVELTDHYLDRMEQLDAAVGAFITTTPELAREQAAAAEDEAFAARREGRELPPLHGVPVPVKDLNNVARVRTTMGSAALTDYVPDVDDHVAARLRAGGSPMPGKTNTPEFGIPCYTENRVAPPARTPWDLTRSAGGSSGGAATAVASGLAPVAHASDGGGSIRIPASACGLYGIKPSRGRVSSGPALHDVTGLATSGPLARTVLDAATLLDVLAGPMPGDPYGAPGLAPGDTFAAHADPSRAPSGLRVAVLTQPPLPDAVVHPECLAAVEGTAKLLRELGHEVDELALPADESMAVSFTKVWSVMATMRPVPEGREELLMPLTRHMRERGAHVPGHEFAKALYTFRTLGQLIADALMTPGTGYDVILSPTVTQPPVPVGGLRDDADPAAEFAAVGRYTPFTPMFNATGQPAVSLPLHWTPEGLPIGVMLGGRYGEDALLVSLSAQLEAAQPWHARRPPVW